MAHEALIRNQPIRSRRMDLSEEFTFDEIDLFILDEQLLRRDDLISERAMALSVHREVNRLVAEHGLAAGAAFEIAFKVIADKAGSVAAHVRSSYATHLPFVFTTVCRGKTSGGQR